MQELPMADTDLNVMFNLAAPVVFDAKQQEAIDACCDVSRRIVAVTGKAGTGKTLIMREVHKRLTDAGYLVQASAPTGKAAKRIREVTGLEAMTNHRMLGYGMPIEHETEDEKTGDKKTVLISTGPRFKRSNPLPYDTILCDEYAMVNQEIHRNIIDALKAGARVCMFGDVNQLKPIEEDRRLDQQSSAFMVALEKFGGITLDTIHRHDAGSGIAQNGALILAGRPPRPSDDFLVRQTDKPVLAVQEWIEHQLADGHNYSDTEHQIITCMNKSWIGTQKLNLIVQAMFWDRARPFIELPRYRETGVETPPIRVQVGSKVVYTANTYDFNDGVSFAFNGETGTVININHADGSVEVDFGDRTVIIPPLIITVYPDGRAVEQDPRRNIQHAYVLTTHKCQGSEYKHVSYVLNKSTMWAQSRRNFYTAVTRAREHCTVFTDMISLAKSTKFAG
jgi:exodeoxyribonuclease V alpha subunit